MLSETDTLTFHGREGLTRLPGNWVSVSRLWSAVEGRQNASCSRTCSACLRNDESAEYFGTITRTPIGNLGSRKIVQSRVTSLMVRTKPASSCARRPFSFIEGRELLCAGEQEYRDDDCGWTRYKLT